MEIIIDEKDDGEKIVMKVANALNIELNLLYKEYIMLKKRKGSKPKPRLVIMLFAS